MSSGTFAIALAARDEADLLRLEERLTLAGITHAAIREPDLPYNNALMSIGILPCERAHVRKFLRDFPLAK